MGNPEKALTALCDRLLPRLSESARAWLDGARREISTDPAAIERHFSAAGRKTPHDLLLSPPPREIVPLLPGGPILNPWRIDDAARALLLVEDARRDSEGALRRANALYFTGTGRERIGVLRALQLLPEGDEALPAVCDALRANAADLFTAAICENAYATWHLSDEAFFQAALKCAFVGVDLRRIVGIRERMKPELARMLFSYVTEREHAGRSVAPELWPLIALCPSAEAAERLRHRNDGTSGN